MLRSTLLLLVGLMGGTAMGQTDSSAVEAQLAAARLRLAPDRRTALFDVHGALTGKVVTLKGEIQSAGMKSALVGMMTAHGWSVRADSLVAMPHPGLKGQNFGVVSVSVLNMRAKPDHAAELVTQAIMGTPLAVLKRERGWFLVQTPDRYLGWTNSPFKQMEKDSFDVWTARPKLFVTATYTFATVDPADGAARVSDLVAGNMLALTGTEGDWFKVEYPDGRSGCVRKSDARPYDEWLAGAHDRPESIVATAHTLMGIPYLWGGARRPRGWTVPGSQNPYIS